jgi:hypothetical protein
MQIFFQIKYPMKRAFISFLVNSVIAARQRRANTRGVVSRSRLARTEAEIRIAMLTAKLKLLDGPPHTL